MKTINLILATLIASMIFVSCEKETEEVQQETTVSTRQKIINFQGEIDNKNRSASTNSYTLEDGLWNVESAISLYRTRVNKQYSNRVKHHLSFNLNVSNNEIAFADLQKLYFEVLDGMQTVWDSYNAEYKFYNMVTVTYNPDEENNVDVKLVFSYGDTETANRSANIFDYFNFFDASENFIFSEYQPDYCSNSSGLDAANAINNAVYYDHIRLQMMQEGAYITYPESYMIFPDDFINPNDNDPYDNYYECMLFTNNSTLPNYHMCLPKSETQTYASYTWTAINWTQANGYFKPVGKQVVDLDLEGGLMAPNEGTFLDHHGYVTYGNIEIEPVIPAFGF